MRSSHRSAAPTIVFVTATGNRRTHINARSSEIRADSSVENGRTTAGKARDFVRTMVERADRQSLTCEHSGTLMDGSASRAFVAGGSDDHDSSFVYGLHCRKNFVAL